MQSSEWEGHLWNDLECLETQVSLRCRAQIGCVVQSVQCHTVAPVRYSLSELRVSCVVQRVQYHTVAPNEVLIVGAQSICVVQSVQCHTVAPVRYSLSELRVSCVVQSVQCHTVAPVRYSLSEVLLVSLLLLSCLGVFIVSYLHVVHNVQCVS